ncbi:hypothetical protein MHM93_19260 [Pseudoalteromonas sp. MM17-2]|nr:hypothetical protein [Pseudoalteromonas sp. MM17-2]MCG7546309.1 hypothetical protein [Pseudoalteromonas sp. MM17-2]
MKKADYNDAEINSPEVVAEFKDELKRSLKDEQFVEITTFSKVVEGAE